MPKWYFVMLLLPLLAKAQSWQSMGPFHPDNLLDIHFIHPDTGFAVGGTPDAARVYRTTNGGLTWNVEVLQDQPIQYAIGSTQDGRLFCSGFEGKGMYSSDLGLSWTSMEFTNGSWMMDWTQTPQGKLIACGLNGSIQVSNQIENGWTVVPSTTQSWLLALACSPEGYLWCVGENGTILKSTDQGNAWEKQDVEAPETLTGLHVLNKDTVFATGFDGLILRTYNGGESWQRIRTGEQNLNDLWFASPLTGWAVGDGIILHTTDGGDSWTQQPYPLNYLEISAITGLANGTLYASGKGGLLLKQSKPMGLESPSHDFLLFPNPSAGWVQWLKPGPNTPAVEIYTTEGRLISTQNPDNQGVLHLNHLPKGTYVLVQGNTRAKLLLNPNEF